MIFYYEFFWQVVSSYRSCDSADINALKFHFIGSSHSFKVGLFIIYPCINNCHHNFFEWLFIYQ